MLVRHAALTAARGARVSLCTTELEEDGVRIALTIVDTPGFGDNIDNEFAYVGFCSAVLFEDSEPFLDSKRSSATSNANTTTSWPRSLASSVTPASGTTAFTRCSTLSLPRVTRACLSRCTMRTRLTISVSLREMDIELMRRLSPRVNVIPVIGKADSLTPSELRGFKKRVRFHSTRFGAPVDLALDHGGHRAL